MISKLIISNYTQWPTASSTSALLITLQRESSSNYMMISPPKLLPTSEHSALEVMFDLNIH